MPRKSSASRFRLLDPEGSAVEIHRATESPGAVLSKALNQASKSEEPGVWEVWEWEDLLYRVHRMRTPGMSLDVRVEIVS